ncbi:MAG TPA: ribosome small subunit-dependent GTPase A [Anaerolineae bacterium]|nr:ribosome small subunit-dependent GTPase A [Anaerolineae bacterium]
MAELRTGIVIQARSGRHRVLDEERGERVTCFVRGRLKKKRLLTDLVATGDRVRWRPTRPGRGVIEEVLARRSKLSRLRPGPGRIPFEHVIVANPDQAVFILAVRDPAPNLRLLDRLLVIAENNDLPAIICANKVDLLDEENQAQAQFGLYAEIGYPVLYTSAHSGQGVEALRARLQGRLSVLSGPSGVGKSSLLNAVQPDLGLAVRAVSRATGKGRHTTVGVRLFPLEGGGYVADTPGLREVGFFDIEPEELDWHFVEMRPYLSDCRFSSCTHTHEPGCAVKAAVAAGAIHPARYESYCRMLGLFGR